MLHPVPRVALLGVDGASSRAGVVLASRGGPAPSPSTAQSLWDTSATVPILVGVRRGWGHQEEPALGYHFAQQLQQLRAGSQPLLNKNESKAPCRYFLVL